MEDKDSEFNINRVSCEEHKDPVTYLHVRDCLSKMPEDERNVLLRCNDGLSVTDVSKETGVRYDKVWRMYQRAKANFKKYFEK